MQLPAPTAAQALARARTRAPGERPAASAWPPSGGARLEPQRCGALPGPAGSGEAVLAYGTLNATFPSLSVEKEFFQAIDPTATADQRITLNAADTVDLWRINRAAEDQGFVYTLLSKPENLYIAREMCWSLQLAGAAGSYLLTPRDDEELSALIAALEPADGKRRPWLIHGRRHAGGEPACRRGGGPALALEKMAAADTATLCAAVTAAGGDLDQTKVTALIEQALPLAGNPGAGDAERALNLVVLAYPELYRHGYGLLYQGQDPDRDGFELSGVRAVPQPATAGKVMAVRLEYRSRDTGRPSRWRCLVDVSGVFPFVVDGIRSELEMGGER